MYICIMKWLKKLFTNKDQAPEPDLEYLLPKWCPRCGWNKPMMYDAEHWCCTTCKTKGKLTPEDWMIGTRMGTTGNH